jgi:nucleoid DNA-binding protein
MPSYMQKQEVLSILAQRTGLTREQVSKVMEEQANLICEQLAVKGGINLPDLGRAKVVVRRAVAARKSVNPRTKEPMVIPAVPEKKTYRVRFGRDFQSRMNEIQAKGPAPVTT